MATGVYVRPAILDRHVRLISMNVDPHHVRMEAPVWIG